MPSDFYRQCGRYPHLAKAAAAARRVATKVDLVSIGEFQSFGVRRYANEK